MVGSLCSGVQCCPVWQLVVHVYDIVIAVYVINNKSLLLSLLRYFVILLIHLAFKRTVCARYD